MTYGLRIESSDFPAPRRDCIAEVDRTSLGNVALTIGRERASGGWFASGTVLLDPQEALALARELQQHARGEHSEGDR